VDSAGDVNGDGLDDLIIGAPANDDASTDAGKAYLVLGPGAGTIGLASADAVFWGDVQYADAGYSVAGVGDTDADGYDDVMISEAGWGNGNALLFLGPISGDVTSSEADATIEGVHGWYTVGWAIAGAGDANGDGYDDVLVSAPNSNGYDHTNSAGSLVLHYGPLYGDIPVDEAHVLLKGQGAYEEAGDSVAFPGDLDGDGIQDLAIGSQYGDDAGYWAGMVYLLDGEYACE